MTRLAWGDPSGRLYDTGLDRGVLYLDGTGVPWNGLVSVDERESGAVNTDHYFDGRRLHISQENGTFEAAISAYTYPDAFAEYNGYSEDETYKRFGFSYRTQYGDGYKIHVVYNALVRDDARSWSTVGGRPDPSLFRWDIYGSAVPISGASPAARLTLGAPTEGVLSLVEDILYGTDSSAPRLPDPAELIELYESATMLKVTYNGDGTYTVSGPDHMVSELPDGRFQIDAPSAFLIDEGIFVVNSY